MGLGENKETWGIEDRIPVWDFGDAYKYSDFFYKMIFEPFGLLSYLYTEMNISGAVLLQKAQHVCKAKYFLHCAEVEHGSNTFWDSGQRKL